MRPRLLDDVRYVEHPEGVYVRSGLGSCVLTGRHVHRWIDRLAPLLRGDRSLEELTRGLPDAHREMVERLVGTLAEQRFVVDARDDRAHTLSGPETAEYAAEIAFIRYGYDSAEWRFQQVREARILLYGRGTVLAAVAEEGLRSGWRRLRVLAVEDAGAVRVAAVRGRRDDAQQVTVETGPPPGDPSLRDHIAGADLVVQVGAGDDAEALAEVARMCADGGVALTQALVRDEDAWCTPVHAREHRLAESGWRWLSAAGRPGPRGEGTSWLTGPVPSLIAAQVTLGCFRHLARMRAERHGAPAGARIRGTMTRVDLRTLHTTAHRFHRHPASLAPAAADASAIRDRITSLRTARRITRAELLERAGSFEDPFLGQVRSLDEEDLPQVPFALCRATVADPYARPRSGAAPSGVGWGADRETARERSLLAALVAYGVRVTEHDLREAPDGPWGMDLLTGAVRRVPRTALFPSRAVPLGAAAGLCWHDAVEAALLAHCEALPELGEGGNATRIDPVREPGDDGDLAELADIVGLLAATGEAFEFRDHGSGIGLPACTVAAAGEVVARSVALTRARALRHAAEHALVAWQARAGGMPEAVSPVRRWAGGDAAAPRRPADLSAIAETLLRATGRAPVVVPLIRDDVAGSLLPFVVQVVLCGD